jgi:uncharacterized protein
MDVNQKRYRTLSSYYKEKFGDKVFKVSLNADFTCPNVDGKAGVGGCTFCSPLGSGDFAGNKQDDLMEQFDDIKTMMHQKWPKAKYIAYFQANTNTYAPVDVLKEKFEQFVNQDSDIVALSISTRPDCLPDDVVEYLADLNKRTTLYVELGLQSIHEESANVINRGHDYQVFVEGVEKLRKHKIETIVHIMNGLPGETPEMMLETAQAVSKLDVQGIKIHMLHVIKNTLMGHQYSKNPFPILTMEEYIDIVIKQLEILPPSMVIHRLTGDAVRENLIAPMWTLKKWVTLNAIDKALEERQTYQGRLYKG